MQVCYDCGADLPKEKIGESKAICHNCEMESMYGDSLKDYESNKPNCCQTCDSILKENESLHCASCAFEILNQISNY